MSPHEQPWLDDYAARHQAELQARWDSEAHVFNIQNAALRVVINECPKPDRTPEDCRICGNENCIKAWKEQNKLWPENACEEPACRANTTNTNQAAAISPAKSESPDTTKCPVPGPPASGSSLFDLIPNDEEVA
jgi:wobble nucleotide-excising tRNase